MADPAHPDYPIENGHPGKMPSELQTGEYPLPAVEHRERGVVANSEVSQALNYLAEQYERFRDRPRTIDDPDYGEFDDHLKQLSTLTAALREVGLSSEQVQLFNQFHGFQKAGREQISVIAGEHGVTMQQVGDFVREVTDRLAKAHWQPSRH